MQTLKFKDGQNALVVVAHPDDETIWLGGTIARHPEVRWTIFSLCRASDTDRAPKFLKVCQLYGAVPIITDLDDENQLSIAQTIPVIKNLLLKNLPTINFDYLFTHGSNGEYGHDRHQGVHQAVKELLIAKQLLINKSLCFNYEKDQTKKQNKTGQEIIKLKPKADSDYLITLSEAELTNKKKIVAEMYGYDFAGIDVNLCTNPEAFKIIE